MFIGIVSEESLVNFWWDKIAGRLLSAIALSIKLLMLVNSIVFVPISMIVRSLGKSSSKK